MAVYKLSFSKHHLVEEKKEKNSPRFALVSAVQWIDICMAIMMHGVTIQ